MEYYIDLSHPMWDGSFLRRGERVRCVTGDVELTGTFLCTEYGDRHTVILDDGTMASFDHGKVLRINTPRSRLNVYTRGMSTSAPAADNDTMSNSIRRVPNAKLRSRQSSEVL